MADDELGALLTLARTAQDRATPVNPGLVRRSGAQRRHRRTAAIGGLAAAVLIGGAGATAWLASPDDHGGDKDQVVAAEADVLGPDGYGDLKLGMGLDEAEATGVVDIGGGGPGQTCRTMSLTAHPPARNTTSGYYSEKYGVAAVFAADDMETPEGIGLGSTLDQVRAAYPTVEEAPNGWYVPVAGQKGTSYYFGVEQDGRVGELAVELDSQDCFG
ncbi:MULTISPECIES: hypothetical protein [unclassified Nocardioides]|uniref:hypothetical protein n=1 Tax=unclassified Nocardioides TaxID=2615069 RepID=UPI0006FA82AA|nr:MULTISPECIES: hypothetical protein [unclassified Nocardioides]KQY62701.1 hypothetical protein ASD30_23640 [Nocardioides sp. Root140]KQZ75898.1 hypothetical protein ASD66_06225 [Nocardioides sp. Root151]